MWEYTLVTCCNKAVKFAVVYNSIPQKDIPSCNDCVLEVWQETGISKYDKRMTIINQLRVSDRREVKLAPITDSYSQKVSFVEL